MFKRHAVPRERIRTLGRIPLFEGVSDKVLSRVDGHLAEITVKSGRELTTQGHGSYEVFIVMEGEAEVTVDGEVVRRTAVGELIGELGVLANRPRTATVRAATPMRLLVMDSREVQWLLDDPIIAERVKGNVDRHQAGPQPD